MSAVPSSPPGSGSRWRACLLAGLLLAAAAGAARAAGPTYQVARDRSVLLGDLPDVLSRPEVAPHLTTGLTTGFLLAVDLREPGGQRRRGAARVDVRWEPWDEVFLVAVTGADGRTRRVTFTSLPALVGWWRALELTVATGLPAGSWTVAVDLRVLPFSHDEQRDAQRWFSGSLAPESSGDPPPGTQAGESRLSGVVDLLMATSIQRRAIVRYAWKATLEPPPPRRTP
jgi:hypothetical protein